MINCDEMGGKIEARNDLPEESPVNQSPLSIDSQESAQTGIIPALKDWTLPPDSVLQKLIAEASSNPDSANFGGGLPPPHLVRKFHQLATEAWWESRKWSNKEIQDTDQYPIAGGALEHRRAVLEYFLGENERKIIKEKFPGVDSEKLDDPRNGLFFTYGSQEGLYLLGKALVKKGNATIDNPIEIAITSPVYPGLLMALDEFIQEGLIKFRLIKVSDDGEIDLASLRDALVSNRCQSIYISEGNPQPIKFKNLDKVAEFLNNPLFEDVLVFEDRAYKDLGASEETLFSMVDNRVIALETFSKKGAPIRFGIVYSNMTPENFTLISKNMLKYQYNSTLGYSGEISGIVYALLNNPELREKFFNHIEEVKEFYEYRRKLYKQTYQDAYDLIFGTDNYNLNNYVTIGDKYFMFGWKKLPIPAEEFVQLTKDLKIYSVPGTSCKPKREFVRGVYDDLDDSEYRLRQNYTFPPEKAFILGIYKSVLIEIAVSEWTNKSKFTAIAQLIDRILSIDKNQSLDDVIGFISNYFRSEQSEIPVSL